jgi:3-deoxy-D-manno-octulosonic-acid transferase
VVEPAALGVPVVFGPRHANAAEAQELIDAGGAMSVQNSSDLERVLAELSAARTQRDRIGAAARNYVNAQRGGAQANAELLLELLERGQHRAHD